MQCCSGLWWIKYCGSRFPLNAACQCIYIWSSIRSMKVTCWCIPHQREWLVLVPSHCRPLYSEATLKLGPASDWSPSLGAGPSLVEAGPWSTGCAYHCCINQQWPVTRGLQSNIQTWDINTETSGVMQQNWPETTNSGMLDLNFIPYLVKMVSSNYNQNICDDVFWSNPKKFESQTK